MSLANHKSSEKRARQTIKKTAVNSQRKSKVKTFEKNLLKALSEKNIKALPDLLKGFSGEIMKAAQHGLFKKETASRKIGRISKRILAALSTK